MLNVPVNRDDSVSKAIHIYVFAQEVICVRLAFVRNNLRYRELFCQQDRNDTRSRSQLKNSISGLDAAEIGEKEAVEGETDTMFRLDDGHDAGAAE